MAGDGDLGDFASAARGDALEVFAQAVVSPVVLFCAASTSAQRSAGEPWREMRPRQTATTGARAACRPSLSLSEIPTLRPIDSGRTRSSRLGPQR